MISSAREPAVCLELSLAGAARPHSPTDCRRGASGEPLEVLPEAAHAREVVLELGKLDLELALGAPRVLGEDVQDQLRAVDDPRIQRVLEVALLRRGQLVVDEERLRSRFAVCALQLLELPLADVRAAVGTVAVLHQQADRLDARCPRELAQLGDLGGLLGARGEHGHEESPLRLPSRRGVWRACVIRSDYAP